METPQDKNLENLTEDDKRINELRYSRGYRTGLAGKPLYEASEAYLDGYNAGRSVFRQNKLKRHY